MDKAIYSDGTYLSHNPEWHAEDSAWKASHIATILKRNGITPKTVCDVGCGAGEVLIELAGRLPEDVRLDGYDVSPDAYKLCGPKSSDRVRFHQGDVTELGVRFDVALAIDVFEHIEDYFGFLRRIKDKATYKVFHIPLDMSAFWVMRGKPIIRQRQSVGHLHYFTKDTAVATLEDTGYRIVDFTYTASAIELAGATGWKTRLLKGPRRLLAKVSPDAAARILGGYSLMVLAE